MRGDPEPVCDDSRAYTVRPSGGGVNRFGIDRHVAVGNGLIPVSLLGRSLII